MKRSNYWVPAALLIVGATFIIWGLSVEGEFGATWKQVVGFGSFGIGMIMLFVGTSSKK